MDIPEGFVLMPIEPTREILEAIVIHDWPNDSTAGHELQQKRGLDLVPPNSEMECAVGQYARIIACGIKSPT